MVILYAGPSLNTTQTTVYTMAMFLIVVSNTNPNSTNPDPKMFVWWQKFAFIRRNVPSMHTTHSYCCL